MIQLWPFIVTQVHTNPIILTFCSILYYKDLDEHVHRYKTERVFAERFIGEDELIKMTPFTGRVADKFFLGDKSRPGSGSKPVSLATATDLHLNMLPAIKKYKKSVLNKWHVIVMLNRNKALIRYRKHHLVPPVPVGPSFLSRVVEKVKSKCGRGCCCCRNAGQPSHSQVVAQTNVWIEWKKILVDFVI